MEYPFKDLLPLDEVLEREGYYKDWTHLDPEVFYSLTQISEYIKTKGYGVDVRLLIAQLAEHFGLKTTQVVDLANSLSTKHDALKDQFDVVIRDATSGADWGGEIVLARGGKATLGQRLDETTTQLAHTEQQLNNTNTNVSNLQTTKADKTYVDNNLASKRDKTTSILLEDLHTEVKTAMTGGSVAVVGENVVGTENLKNEAATSLKRTPLGDFAMLQITSEPPNFDFTNRTLTIPNGVNGRHEVVHRQNIYPLPMGKIVIDLNMGSGYDRGFITFDVKLSSFKVYSSLTRQNITENEVMMGAFHHGSKKAYLNCTFLVNGLPPSLTSGVQIDQITDIPHMWKHCTVLLGGKNLPVVDNNAKVLRFPQNGFDNIIYVGGTTYTMSPPAEGFTIDLSDTTETSAWCILFNTSNKEFVLSKWSDTSQFRLNHAIFATFRIANGKYYFNMPCPFLVDGKLYGFSDATNIVENPMNANVKAVAHRGYSLEAPENTLPAYELARQKGYSYVEVDIEWTSDNIPVCLHDGTIDRTSNGTGNIRDLTLEQVKSYDFGSWKSSQYTGTKIPTLEEFLLVCKKLNLHPYLESKGGISNEQAEILVKTVKKLGMDGRVTWICFSSYVLSSLLNFDNKARIGLVGDLSESLINTALSLKNESNEVFVDSSYSTVTKELAEMVMLNDMDLEVWTVNSESLVDGLIKNGVSGITTDMLNIAEILSN